MARKPASEPASERQSEAQKVTADNSGYVTFGRSDEHARRTERPEVVTQDDGLTVEQVAFLTGRSPWLIRRWLRDGTLPGVRLEHERGQPWRVRAADLALVWRRRRWGATVPPGVPARLAAVASIAGVGQESEGRRP
jgi:hypothetical protein